MKSQLPVLRAAIGRPCPAERGTLSRVTSPTNDRPLAPDESSPVTDDQGVDLTLIRHTLRMTPTERLRALESYMNTFATARVIRRAADGDSTR